MSRWWKCDLQVATPAWDFQLPAGTCFDFSELESRREFASQYMRILQARGIEIIAIADHNTGEWIDVMVEVGSEYGVSVFPGCEVTTGTGADGVHLIIIGDRDKKSQDFDRLLASALGFPEGHARYHTVNGRKQPASSAKTLGQILDDLPDGYLVVAPHALTDNGIASATTVKGDLRWKALHHRRLGAIDVGTSTDPDGNGFNQRFRRRELDNFPCLASLPFVATSDAYSFDELGTKFTWIRMGEPTLEGLRQSFLDYRARVICCHDPRLNEYRSEDPNQIRHGWIDSLDVGGALGNSTTGFNLKLHPGLNVIIGGRGSGKSTVVSALRLLYAGNLSLPDRIREEAETFATAVFPQAAINAVHHVEASQDTHAVRWTRETGSTTTVDERSYPTTFKVRVVNQKELFERVSSHPSDPSAASRSFLAMLDEGLGLLKMTPVPPDSWWHKLVDAQNRWQEAMREFQRLSQDITQLPQTAGELSQLEKQIEAFDSAEAKDRRTRNSNRLEEQQELDAMVASTQGTLTSVEVLTLPSSLADDDTTAADTEQEEASVLEPSSEFQSVVDGLAQIEQQFVQQLRNALQSTRAAIDNWRVSKPYVTWDSLVSNAHADNERYIEELTARGIDPASYKQIQDRLIQCQAVMRTLQLSVQQRGTKQQDVVTAWNAIDSLAAERRAARQVLLDSVANHSERLRFSLQPFQDVLGWVSTVRELLNLRADGFLDDVPGMGQWIWAATSSEEQRQRADNWRSALATGDFTNIAGRDNANLRTPFVRKLESLDETLRLRLAVELPDDLILMEFLRDGGRRDNPDDWQHITKGSPGQRTAAMLGFILGHGSEPLVLDQPEDDLDTEWVSNLVVTQLRLSRWRRQLIVVTHNANIPVNGDADCVIVLENRDGSIRVRESAAGHHCGPIEFPHVRQDIQNIMEGGIEAFAQREKRYKTDVQL